MKNKKNKKRNNKLNTKGITLISLVVTIVVMLILAGIVIGTTIGKNSILETSKNESFKTERKTWVETLRMELLDKQREVLDPIGNEEIAKVLGKHGEVYYTDTNNVDGVKIDNRFDIKLYEIWNLKDFRNPIGILNLASTTNSIEVNVNAEDNNSVRLNYASGIKGYCYSIDDGKTYTDLIKEDTYIFNNLIQDKEYNLKVEIFDNAGNTEIVEEKINTKKVTKVNIIVDKADEWQRKKKITVIPENSNYTIIRYTLDGTIPTINSPEYTTGFDVYKDCTITALAFDSSNQMGEPEQQNVIKIEPLELTIAVDKPDVWTNKSKHVTISSNKDDYSVIKYTLDGTIPDITNGIVYSEPFEVEENCTVIAVVYDDENSVLDSAENTITKIDKIAPGKASVDLGDYISGMYTADNVVQTFFATDNVAIGKFEIEYTNNGVAKTKICECACDSNDPNKNFITDLANDPIIWTVTGDGEKVLRVRAYDHVGNVGEWSDEYEIKKWPKLSTKAVGTKVTLGSKTCYVYNSSWLCTLGDNLTISGNTQDAAITAMGTQATNLLDKYSTYATEAKAATIDHQTNLKQVFTGSTGGWLASKCTTSGNGNTYYGMYAIDSKTLYFENVYVKNASGSYSSFSYTKKPILLLKMRTNLFVNGDGKIVRNPIPSKLFSDEKLKIGDYVNYDHLKGVTTATTYTSKVANNGYADQVFDLNDYSATDGWQVLGVDGDYIQLISSRVVPVQSGSEVGNLFTLQGSKGYVKGPDELTAISQFYSQGTYATSSKAVSVGIAHIDGITGYNKKNYLPGQLNDYGNSITYKWNKSEYPKYSSTNYSGNLTDSHSGSGFIYYDSTPAKQTSAYSATSTSSISTFTSTYYTYESDNENYLKLNLNNSWIANRSRNCLPSRVYYGIRCIKDNKIDALPVIDSTGQTYSNSMYVRPVVYLKCVNHTVVKEPNSEDHWRII